ncbi:MAG: hypothetical protein WC655_20600 [Candidatus Hydrogenedentales bacterium]|jgi:hypothetical protein
MGDKSQKDKDKGRRQKAEKVVKDATKKRVQMEEVKPLLRP